MPLTITSLDALEILDSRGRPTIEVTAGLSDGSTGVAQVPSGASTGRHEALELRDHDASRYRGYGVLNAVRNVTQEIAPALTGRSGEDLRQVDASLIELDGTADKSRLGANAILGVSCAVTRALSAARKQPLWRILSDAFQRPSVPVIPRPMINILSGGHHAGHNIEIQDFLVVPLRFDSFREALRAAVEVHAATRECLADAGLVVTGVADEGGWGPLFSSNESALRLLTQGIERAGYLPGEDCAIAIDVAASHFFIEGKYHLANNGSSLTSSEMIDIMQRWTREYPVISLEDALDQDDWESWRGLTASLGDTVQLIGDDLFTTNPERVSRGIAEKTANAVLVKMNQIGTLSETFDVVRLASDAGWRAVISARSGETEDSFLADLATATGAGQIKVGSITRSERLAKYNRLLKLESEGQLEYAGPALTPAG